MESIDISGLQEALFTAIVKYKTVRVPLEYSEACDSKEIKDIVDQLVTLEAVGMEVDGPWPAYRLAIGLVNWCVIKKPTVRSWILLVLGYTQH